MNHATPRMRFLANRLIAHEGSTCNSPPTENQVTVVVVQKLRPNIKDLMGNTGFHALVSHSLALAKEETPWLAGARLNADGTFDGLEGSLDPSDPKRISTGGSVMLAWLLGQLSAVIGELLTMQLILEVWPQLPVSGYFSQANHHEKTL